MMFTEAERKIFGPYFNGAELVYADPLRVHRRLLYMLDGETNKWLEKAKSENLEERFQAKEKLLPAVVYALDMLPFDPKTGLGSLEQDVIAALRSYLEFMEGKGPRVPSMPISVPPMGPGLSAPAPTMQPMWPSGVTSTGPNYVRPGQ